MQFIFIITNLVHTYFKTRFMATQLGKGEFVLIFSGNYNHDFWLLSSSLTRHLISQISSEYQRIRKLLPSSIKLSHFLFSLRSQILLLTTNLFSLRDVMCFVHLQENILHTFSLDYLYLLVLGQLCFVMESSGISL